MPFEVFCEITKGLEIDKLNEGDLQTLYLFLEEADKKGKQEEDAFRKLLKERLSALSGSMIYHKLIIKVPKGVDVDHAQAYIVYGLLSSGQSRTFSGRHVISEQVLRNMVENKLGAFFNKDKFEDAQRWLIKIGVVVSTRKGVALNSACETCSKEGKAIVKEAQRFKLELLKLI